MIYPVKTDLLPLLENLVAAIRPFAKANFVRLQFKSEPGKIEIEHHPETIIPGLTRLLCRAITFTPQEYEVTLEVRLAEEFVQVQVTNTGANLDHLQEMTAGIGQQVLVKQREGGGTIFELRLPAKRAETTNEKIQITAPGRNKTFTVPPFFKKLGHSLRSHFTSIENLEKAAGGRSDREGVFLKKVHAVIIAHLDQEDFDTAGLCKAMALSRSQLYRRLKPLIRLAPAHYVKYVRLQKAREMLDKSELTVGEVAFRTGFVNQSHFTRAFREQFGFNPSDVRRNQKNGADHSQSQQVLKKTHHEAAAKKQAVLSEIQRRFERQGKAGSIDSPVRR